MSSLSYAVGDSSTMLWRNLKHMLRYPSMTVMLLGIPVIFLLLFVYIFGGTLGNGLDGASGGRSAYANYVVPGILLITIAGTATGTAVAVSMDMTEGIIARFRTMAIFRPSVLTGHVVGSMIQTMIALAAVVGVALLVGFRPTATPLEWLAAVGVLLMITFATTWFAVACGLAAKSVESASNMPMPLTLLPFLGSGFVPTDNMPAAVAWFADYQPFTPVIETLRGLLLGTAIGGNGILAAAWSVVISAGCFLWSRRLYSRDPAVSATR
jgi:ABC-2 type transport system permease protein